MSTQKKGLLKGLAGGFILGLLIASMSGYFIFKRKVSTTRLVANRGIMIPAGMGEKTSHCITVSNYETFRKEKFNNLDLSTYKSAKPIATFLVENWDIVPLQAVFHPKYLPVSCAEDSNIVYFLFLQGDEYRLYKNDATYTKINAQNDEKAFEEAYNLLQGVGIVKH